MATAPCFARAITSGRLVAGEDSQVDNSSRRREMESPRSGCCRRRYWEQTLQEPRRNVSMLHACSRRCSAGWQLLQQLRRAQPAVVEFTTLVRCAVVRPKRSLCVLLVTRLARRCAVLPVKNLFHVTPNGAQGSHRECSLKTG
jgi:hypothetical protein